MVLPSAKTAAVLAAWGLIATSLVGCSFSTTGETCKSDGCDCSVNFYSGEANIFFGDTPIEHASRRFVVPNIDRSTVNGSVAPCCISMNGMLSAMIKNTPAPNTSLFCSQCRTSPNKDVAAAAAADPGCIAPSALLAPRRLLTPPAAPTDVGSLVAAAGSDPDENDFSDCEFSFVGTDAQVKFNSVILSDATNAFKFKSTDLKSAASPACCLALRPLVSELLVMKVPVSTSVAANFCGACRGAYNTGLALAAYRCPWTSTSAAAAAASSADVVL